MIVITRFFDFLNFSMENFDLSGMKLLLVLSITVICGMAKASEEHKALADLTLEGKKAYSNVGLNF